jgi:NitT/TauT family transport system substrate-binding protein
MKIALPDLISNSYFPAAAASALGFFKAEGLDLEHELVFPVDRAYRDLRDGKVDFVAGSAHSALAAFPDWKGVKLLCAQAGYDLVRDDIKIAPVPGAAAGSSPTVNFGLTAAKALEEGTIDGFWANGMGAEVAVTRGIGTVVLDIRRGDGPKPCFNYTMASVATTDALIARAPEQAAAVVRAIVKTQRALAADPALAAKAGTMLFPPPEAALIAELIRRDVPYYDASIGRDFVAGMNQFGRDLGILKGAPAYEDVVATQFAPLWKE